MSWIDDDAAEVRRLHEAAAELNERHARIAESSERVYNDLWKELVEKIKEAKNKGIPHAANLITNGEPFERKILEHQIIVPQIPKPPAQTSKPKYVTVKLTGDRQKIEVTGTRQSSLFLPLDFGDDGVVLIKHEGEFLQIQEVARMILKPVFFPELFALSA
jgi:hypothetical protein